MTRTIFALLFTLVALCAFAEAGQRGPRRGPPPFTELANALALTEAQVAPTMAIFETQREQMRALDEPNREQREQIRAATKASLAAILSAEQMQKLEEFHASHRPPSRDSNQDGRRPPRR